ncbi:outer membrane protein [Brucella sp. BE17]|uniref:outer membrane protein n=1 Tax=Brucella sp. BE17 TaxID=3142977 RepID=UPI0031BA28E9
MKLNLFLLVSGACLAASGAQAADAIVEPAPVPVVIAPSFTWSGAYIGGQVGYGWGKSRLTASNPDDDVNIFNLKPDGFLGGLYAGYNFDLGNSVVLGIDADATYNDLSGKQSETIDDVTGTLESNLRWSGALRARAGYAVDRVMPYIAGGVAFGNISAKVTVLGESREATNTYTGWTAGAGVDYAATDNVVLRLEYRYTDYGKHSYESQYSKVDNKFKTSDVRLGVAYKF